jgi:hypothetical protein
MPRVDATGLAANLAMRFQQAPSHVHPKIRSPRRPGKLPLSLVTASNSVQIAAGAGDQRQGSCARGLD